MGGIGKQKFMQMDAYTSTYTVRKSEEAEADWLTDWLHWIV